MAGRINFPSRFKKRITKVIENLNKKISNGRPEGADSDSHARKVEIAKKDLEILTAKLANLV